MYRQIFFLIKYFFAWICENVTFLATEIVENHFKIGVYINIIIIKKKCCFKPEVEWSHAPGTVYLVVSLWVTGSVCECQWKERGRFVTWVKGLDSKFRMYVAKAQAAHAGTIKLFYKTTS